MRVARERRAFTLVELLVVIAIIGILAAMLAVGLNTVRRFALQTTCVNNLKQIGMALSMYLQDDDNGILPLVTSANDNGDPKDWPDVLRPYLGLGKWDDDIRVKDEGDWGTGRAGRYKVFDCPGNKRPASDAPGNRFDYTYNIKLANSPTGGPWLYERCGNVVVLHDQVHIAAPRVNECLGIHNGEDNFLFLAGHVKQSKTYGDISENEEPWDPTL